VRGRLLLAAALWAQVTPLVGHLETADNCVVAHLTISVDKGGVCVTTDSGAFVCDAPGLPGDEVRLLLPAHPKCLVFYPPDGRTTLKRPEARESIAVTLVERDSPRWKSTEELRALLRASPIRRDAQGLTPQQLDDRLKAWMVSVREGTGRDNEAFARLLVRKQGQIQEFSRVSEVFHRFINRGRNLVAAFRLHAVGAPFRPEEARFLIDEIHDYNPVFDELAEHGDAYEATVLSYWGQEAAAGYHRLLGLALAAHRETLYRVNDLNVRINALSSGALRGDERRGKLGELADANAAWVAEAGARLDALVPEIDVYLAQLKGALADF
jgi:hypothetical protein